MHFGIIVEAGKLCLLEIKDDMKVFKHVVLAPEAFPVHTSHIIPEL